MLLHPFLSFQRVRVWGRNVNLLHGGASSLYGFCFLPSTERIALSPLPSVGFENIHQGHKLTDTSTEKEKKRKKKWKVVLIFRNLRGCGCVGVWACLGVCVLCRKCAYCCGNPPACRAQRLITNGDIYTNLCGGAFHFFV